MANQNPTVDTTSDPSLQYIADNLYNRTVIPTNKSTGASVGTSIGGTQTSNNPVVINEIKNVTQITLTPPSGRPAIPGGIPGQVQVNINNGLAGSPGLTYDAVTNVLRAANIVATHLEVTNNADLGDISRVKLGGGNAGGTLQTDGYGNLSFVDVVIPNLTGYATESWVNTNVIGSAPANLNTLVEIANAINNDNNFHTTITTALSGKAATSSLSTVATSGSYNDLSNKPTRLSDATGNTLFIANGTNASVQLKSVTSTDISFLFTNDGKLKLPPLGDIVDSTGTSVLGGAGGGGGGGTSLTFTNGGGVYQSGGPINWDTYIESQHDVRIQVGGGNTFKFNTSGKIQLPTGGDIIDSSGNSVLTNVSSFLQTYTGNITANNITANIPGANVIGSVANATYANNSNIANTVTASSQPNITSVGTLTSLTVAGGLTVNGQLSGGGLTTTAGINPPVSPIIGDTWYDTTNDVTYRYIDDGVTNGIWVDYSGPSYSVIDGINCVRQIINAGQGLSMDLLTVQMPTGGNRSLQLKVATGTIVANWSGSAVYYGGGATQASSDSSRAQTFTTSYTYISSLWNFLSPGDSADYMFNDTTNNKFYRITLQVGAGFNNNLSVIERLAP
jgi:hypothetical protein